MHKTPKKDEITEKDSRNIRKVKRNYMKNSGTYA